MISWHTDVPSPGAAAIIGFAVHARNKSVVFIRVVFGVEVFRQEVTQA